MQSLSLRTFGSRDDTIDENHRKGAESGGIAERLAGGAEFPEGRCGSTEAGLARQEPHTRDYEATVRQSEKGGRLPEFGLERKEREADAGRRGRAAYDQR